jgi:hypothetical protein
MWIKCHDGLMRGAKRGLSRATRFIYLELCQEARDGRGTIALPLGMDAVDAVADLLGGNRGEIEAALPKLCSGTEPMVRIEGPEGELRLVVVAWARWNAAETSTERVRKHRRQEATGSETTALERHETHETPSNAFPVEQAERAGTPLDQSREEEIREDPTHTSARAGERERVKSPVPEAPSPGEPRALVALRAQPAITVAAETAPCGARVALLRLAELVEGRALAAGKPMAWIFEAVSQAGADLAAEGPGLQWAAAAKKIRTYTDAARAPRSDAANGARASPQSRSTAQKCPEPGQRFDAGTEYTA